MTNRDTTTNTNTTTTTNTTTDSIRTRSIHAVSTGTCTGTSGATRSGADRGRRSRRRRGTILGVSAGVLGGGLAGLALTVPSLTDAAGEGTTDTVVSAPNGIDTVSALQESDTTTDEAARPGRGARLRESLQELVDAGTITAEQADAVADHLASQLPEHRGRRGRHPGMDGEVVAELLGIDVEQLRSSLREGRTIAEIAEANGVDVEIVVDALVAEAQRHLDLAVENGRLTEEEATQKAAELAERITARVHGERPARGLS